MSRANSPGGCVWSRRGIEQLTATLSGGNQQKVLLAKWLIPAPRVLILDQPTRGIDVGAKAEIHRIVSHLAAQGMAIILISDDAPEVIAMADRILVLRTGRLVARVRARGVRSARRSCWPPRICHHADRRRRHDGSRGDAVSRLTAHSRELRPGRRAAGDLRRRDAARAALPQRRESRTGGAVRDAGLHRGARRGAGHHRAPDRPLRGRDRRHQRLCRRGLARRRIRTAASRSCS